MPIVNKDSLTRELNPINPIGQTNAGMNNLGSQMAQANDFLKNLMSLVDKAKDFKKVSQNGLNEQKPTNEAINQETRTHFPKLIVDEIKAVEQMTLLIKNIPEQFDSFTVKQLKDEVDNYKDMSKNYIVNFIKSCVRLE